MNLTRERLIYLLIIGVLLAALVFMMLMASTKDQLQPAVERQTASIEEAVTAETSSEYYFKAVEEEGNVNIYKVWGDTETLYQTTEIPFSLLSQEDQKQLREGIVLENTEQLDDFLENFDS